MTFYLLDFAFSLSRYPLDVFLGLARIASSWRLVLPYPAGVHNGLAFSDSTIHEIMTGNISAISVECIYHVYRVWNI